MLTKRDRKSPEAAPPDAIQPPLKWQQGDWILRVQARLHHRKRGLLGRYQKTSVLVPLVLLENGEMGVVFEERSHTMRRQPGEISFPGGHFEEGKDEDEQETAVRETSEELGIARQGIQILGELDVFAPFTGLLVYPYVGLLTPYPALAPNPAEVERIFVIELSRLLEVKPEVFTVPLKPDPPADFPYHLIPNGRDYAWRTSKTEQWFYEMDGQVIWGLTARILTHFLDLLR